MSERKTKLIKYKAIVSIEFDSDDLAELAAHYGVEPERMNPRDTLFGALQNLELGTGWIEQLGRADE